MRFSTIHKASAYLMCLSALAALLLSPELGLPAVALTLLAVALSWFADPGRFRLERFTAVWNIATVLFFLYLALEVARGGAVILAGAHFLLFVLCNKLYNRRSSRDYLQASVVSFLILVVATTLNTSLSYAIAFAAYVVFATWTLILLHLRREMEENYLLKHSEGAQSEKVEVERILSSRRVVGGKFLLGTSLLSIGVIIVSALVFLLFPRVGFGIFLGQKRGGVTIAGFQDRVELGQHGVIRDNPSVVMRVSLPGDRSPGVMRWRGSAFDRYQGGVWSHSEELAGRTQLVSSRDHLYVLNHAPGLPAEAAPARLRQTLLRQQIYLEPLDSSILFAADRPVALEAPRRGLARRLGYFMPRRGPLGEIRTGAPRSAGLEYIAYSKIEPPPVALLRRAQPLRDPRLSSFLQLPPDLPRRIGELAQEIVAGKSTIYDRVMAVQEHLRSRYQYTLELRHRQGLEPVDEFLFVNRRGHCEYFSSAMTLLLRSLGIHARNVNGFAGGVWNSYGKYLAVRQGDAHSWVEVLFSNLGWVTFDPTPGAGLPVPVSGMLAGAGQLLDAIRMRWYRHVVEFDLRQQVSMLREAQRWFSTRPAGAPRARPPWALILSAAGLPLLLLLLWRWRRRFARPARSPARHRQVALQVSQLYARALHLLARAGHPKPPGSTPREFARALAERGLPAAGLVDRLTAWYYDLRFGELSFGPEAAQQMGELIKELRRVLRAR